MPGIRAEARRARASPTSAAGRQRDPRQAGARADPVARHSAGLHRRLDLPPSQRAHPGDRSRRARPEAVPLPPAVAGGPRRDQVRPDARVQRGAPGHPRAGRERPRPPRPAAREGARRPSSGCSSAPGSGSATTSTPRRTARSGSPPCADHHVEISGSTLRFQFRGKSGKIHDVELTDRRLARIVAPLPGPPGRGAVPVRGRRRETGRRSDSGDVNDYLREISGQDFTAKDFRTWAGTILAVAALRELGPHGRRARGEVDASSRRSIGWPSSSTTPGRCAGSTTCTRPSSRPITAGSLLDALANGNGGRARRQGADGRRAGAGAPAPEKGLTGGGAASSRAAAATASATPAAAAAAATFTTPAHDAPRRGWSSGSG